MRATPPTADTALILAQMKAAPGWDRARALAPDAEQACDDMLSAILEEASRFADGVLSPLNAVMDRVGCSLSEARVRTAPGHPEAWRVFVDNGWTSLGQPIAHGGQPLPTAVWAACESVFDRANPAFAMLPVPQISSAKLISAWGSDDLKSEWLPRLVGGEWGATICISEPDAGSDVGRIRTTARPDGDGGWIVSGEKCWISFGDHDLSSRIGHCLLARTPDGAPGSAGLSLFLVPDRSEDGTRNGVVVRRLEEKMGLHGSPTCALGFEDASAVLIGQEGRGLAQMFVMIANMRLAVAIQGLGIASAATDIAFTYAAERKQGGSGKSPPVAINTHADVQRMLLEMSAATETLRGLIFALANQVDLAEREPDPTARDEAAALSQWLLPIVKTAGAEVALAVASLGIQVLGGAGYTREWPIEQGMRDARVLSVFEGTTGIQALDLLHRRLLADGRGLAVFMDRARAAAMASPQGSLLNACLDSLGRAAETLRATDRSAAEAGATAFLSLAILSAQGWIAAHLSALASDDDAGRTLQAAGRYFLSRIGPRALLLETEAMNAADPLTNFSGLNKGLGPEG